LTYSSILNNLLNLRVKYEINLENSTILVSISLLNVSVFSIMGEEYLKYKKASYFLFNKKANLCSIYPISFKDSKI
jgi:hypothetical protein